MSRVYVECKPDEELVRSLIGREAGVDVIHGSNKSEVVKAVRKAAKEGAGSVVGVVDEDPDSAQPKSLRGEFDVDRELGHLKVLVLRGGSARLVVLRPRLEGWVLRACKLCGVEPEKFGLSGKEDDLHRVINSKLDNFRRLLDELRNDECSMMGELESVLGALSREE
ncbi:MAG: hypothetical protein ACP5UD_09605 [Conexivisphaera sp.]|jgi:hypothetical protein